MMFISLQFPLLLASGSPRRKEILAAAGFSFEVEVRPTNESFDPNLPIEEIPVFLARQKLSQFDDKKDTIVMCADTIVAIDEQVLNKPENKEEAMAMLRQLSGKNHKVITGVAIKLNDQTSSFYDLTEVTFKKLSEDECNFYVDNWKPFDKAGGYGVQEFMGMVGIESLTGSYYNVMGLPIHKVYEELKSFVRW